MKTLSEWIKEIETKRLEDEREAAEEQRQTSAEYNAYISSYRSYSEEEMRDFGHTWGPGFEPEDKPVDELADYNKVQGPQLEILKKMIERNYPDEDINYIFLSKCGWDYDYPIDKLGEEYVYSESIERLQKAVQMYEYVELTEEEKSEYLPSDIALREIDEDGYIPLMYTVDETKLCRELQISYNVPEQQLHYFVCRSLVKAERWSIDEMIAYLEDEPDKIWEDLYDKAIDAEIRTGINVDEDSINDTAECQKEDEAILEKAEQAALQERKLLLGKNIVQKQSYEEKVDKILKEKNKEETK